MFNEPLGLPRGSVRAIITILLIVVSAVLLFVPPVNDPVSSMFIMLTGLAVKDYYDIRKVQNVADGPPLAQPSYNDQE